MSLMKSKYFYLCWKLLKKANKLLRHRETFPSPEITFSSYNKLKEIKHILETIKHYLSIRSSFLKNTPMTILSSQLKYLRTVRTRVSAKKRKVNKILLLSMVFTYQLVSLHSCLLP